MSQDELTTLRNRVKELEAELAEREKDLQKFNEELRSTNKKLEELVNQVSQELRLAARIQRALVPTEFSNIGGFEFSTKFINGSESGGDYFDVFEYEDKMRYGIVVSSATGYAMSALFLSVILKLTGRIEAARGLSADRVVEMMVKEIVPNIEGNEQANIFYGVVDRRNFEFSYCCAGNIIGLLLTYASDKLMRLESHVPSIAKGFSANLTSETFALNPRDRLIFCTSGVVNAANKDGEKFGEERLYKSILRAPKTGAHELRNEILYQVERFNGDLKLKRDLTAVVVEVKDRVIKLARDL